MAHDHSNHGQPEEAWEDADHSSVTDDAWHDHSHDELPQHAHGETTPGAIALVGLVSFGLLVACIVGVWIFFNQLLRAEYDLKQDMFTGDEVVELKATWEAQLNEYGWADPQNNRVRVPIDRAAEAVAAEFARNAK